MPTPIPAPDRHPARGTGIFDGPAMGLPAWDDTVAADWDPAELDDWHPAEADWGPAEAADWDPAELDDWDRAELDGWAPEDPAGEPLELAMPEPEASGPAAERRGPGCAERGSPAALKAGPRAGTGGDGGWFAAGGVADELLPGPRLAGFMADAGAIGLGQAHRQ